MKNPVKNEVRGSYKKVTEHVINVGDLQKSREMNNCPPKNYGIVVTGVDTSFVINSSKSPYFYKPD